MSASDPGGPTDGGALRRINAALVELARLRMRYEEDLGRAFREMTEVAARGIGVARASIWLAEAQGSLLVCQDLYDVRSAEHHQSEALRVEDYPIYFDALAGLRVVVAADARLDPRTAIFWKSYLEPSGIGALLDAPAHHQNQLVGVVCLEHVGGPRAWTPEEEVFAGSVSDQVSLLVQAAGRRRTEEALLESQRQVGRSLSQLAATLEATADGILVVDGQGQVTGYNQGFLSLWQLEEDSVKGAQEAQILHQLKGQLRQPERLVETFRRLAGTPDAHSFEVIEFHDGRVYERSSKPQKLDGQTVGRVWSFRDITERRRHEEEAQVLQAELFQAQKVEAIGTLAGGIAHDFNNILGVILGHASVARAEVGPDHAIAENLAEISRAGERARALVEQILTFSRRRPEQQQAMALNQVVERALRLLRASLPASIEIDLAVEGESLVVLADINQVHQVLMNLGTNAAHAMRAHGGQLQVRVSGVVLEADGIPPGTNLLPGPYVRVVVGDSGHGMSPDILEHIFEPFFTTKGQGEGTGLGLAVAQSIMLNHQGAITAHSELDVGTRFELYFPQLDLDRLPDEPTPGIAPEGDGQHLLLVDDEPQLVASGARLLEKLNYRVTGCISADDALQHLRSGTHFDLLITDLSMPKMDGLELARECHRLRPELPVMLTSGYFGELDPGSTSPAGIRILLTKPFNQISLAESVMRALGR